MSTVAREGAHGERGMFMDACGRGGGRTPHIVSHRVSRSGGWLRI